MDRSSETLALLRLLQVTDSSFPIGGYAYSHGIEWLVAERRVAGERDLSAALAPFVAQVIRHQWLPAAASAFRARSAVRRSGVDATMDASIVAAAERDAGRAMGARLLEVAAAAVLAGPGVEAMRADTLSGRSPGQFAVAFAVAARDFGVGEAAMLSALGFSAVSSVTQAAVRLGVIGPEAAARLVASTGDQLAAAVESVRAQPRLRIGAFTPGLELAAMLQPTLRFRMFAS